MKALHVVRQDYLGLFLGFDLGLPTLPVIGKALFQWLRYSDRACPCRTCMHGASLLASQPHGGGCAVTCSRTHGAIDGICRTIRTPNHPFHIPLAQPWLWQMPKILDGGVVYA